MVGQHFEHRHAVDVVPFHQGFVVVLEQVELLHVEVEVFVLLVLADQGVESEERGVVGGVAGQGLEGAVVDEEGVGGHVLGRDGSRGSPLE